MSSIESVSAALYDIYTAKNKLAAVRVAALEWEKQVDEWTGCPINESQNKFAIAAFDICHNHMYKVFVSEDDDEEFSKNVYAARVAWRTIAQLWKAMTAEDDE